MKKYAEGGGFDFEVPMPRKGGYGGPQDEGDTPEKPPVVTKKMLADSGYDNLRDYLNAQRGLTRRKPKDAPKAAEPMEKPKAKYETPIDRYARKNRETAQSEESMSEYKPRRGRMVGDTEVDTNTLLPKKYAKGGSVSGRADGIAKKGKTNCKMV